jgi:hypothetical protein
MNSSSSRKTTPVLFYRLKYRVATLLPSSERYVAVVHTNDLVVSGKTNTSKER